VPPFFKHRPTGVVNSSHPAKGCGQRADGLRFAVADCAPSVAGALDPEYPAGGKRANCPIEVTALIHIEDAAG